MEERNERMNEVPVWGAVEFKMMDLGGNRGLSVKRV